MKRECYKDILDHAPTSLRVKYIGIVGHIGVFTIYAILVLLFHFYILNIYFFLMAVTATQLLVDLLIGFLVCSKYGKW